MSDAGESEVKSSEIFSTPQPSDSAKQEKGQRTENIGQAEAFSKDAEIPSTGLSSDNKGDPLEEMKRVKGFYKEFIAIAKDTLDVGWKLAPLAFLPAGLLLWGYLRSIYWSGLFLDSATAASGLVFLFVAAFLLAFAVLAQFAAPSLILIATVSGSPYQDQVIPKYVANIYYAALAGWFLGVSIVIFRNSSNGNWIALALPIATSLFVLLMHMRKTFQSLPRGKNLFFWLGKNAWWSLTAAFAMGTTSLPLVIGLKIAGHVPNIEDWQAWAAILICVGISIVSLIPGLMYLGIRTASTSAYRAMKFAFGGAIFTSYIVISSIAFFAPISSTVLRLSGIYNNDLQTFQVREPTLTAAFSAVGLPITITNKPDLTLVQARLRYGFGGVKLLCKEKFDPAAISPDLRKKAHLEKKPDPGFIAGSHCVPTYANEVREIRQ